MSQSLFSGLELLVKRRELLQDLCKVWNLQLACFIARANWSVFKSNRGENREYLKCAGESMQAVAALEAQQLLEMVRALSDALELASPVVDLADMAVLAKLIIPFAEAPLLCIDSLLNHTLGTPVCGIPYICSLLEAICLHSAMY